MATTYYDTDAICPPFPGRWELWAADTTNWDLFVDRQSNPDPQRCRVISVAKVEGCRSTHYGDVQYAQHMQALYPRRAHAPVDRKSTRLNSSHIQKSRMPSSA